MPEKARYSPAFAALAQAAGGSASGAFAAFVLHPLELVKTRIQTGRSQPPLGRAVAELLRAEGLAALYRGVVAQCCEEATENFVFFYLYELCRKAVQLRWQLTASLNLAVGYVAGVGTTTLVLPIEVLSTQLQLSQSQDGLFSALSHTLRAEGLSGLFKGYWLNLILCANPAIQNTVFDKAKAAVLKRTALHSSMRPVLSPLEALLLGAAAKAVALALCYPLVRLKVAIQAGKQAHKPEPSAPVCGAAGELAESQAMRLLRRIALVYRGLGTALAKNVFSAALLYMMKDQIARAVVSAFLLSSRALQRRTLAK